MTKVKEKNWVQLDFLINNFYEIIEYKRANNEYFEYVQNYLNEVEQKVYI